MLLKLKSCIVFLICNRTIDMMCDFKVHGNSLPLFQVKEKQLNISGRTHCKWHNTYQSDIFSLNCQGDCWTWHQDNQWGDIRIIFLSQTVVVFLGNSYLLHHYLLFNFSGYTLRSTDWILMHLTVANILTLLWKRVPQTMASFGLKDFLNDFRCQGLFYLHSVGRGVHRQH